MSIFKRTDYTEQFEKLFQMVEKNNTEITKAIISSKNTEKEVKQLSLEIINLKDEIHELKTVISELKEQPKETIIQNENAVSEPIWKHKKYDVFKKDREYSLDKQQFFLNSAQGRARPMVLTFEQLIHIIRGTKNGLTPPTMKKVNPLLANLNTAQIRNYTYIWRAGGFNKAIKKNARVLGYNPKHLVNHECDGI